MSLRLFVLFALYAFFSFSEVALAQNTLIASEDFEGISYITTINDTGLASNTGSNKWIINNQYNGGAIYPNTISQDSTFGGLITFPNGNYLHIHDSVASVNNSIANTNYDPQSISDRFAVIDEFCTLGYNGVTVAYYYLCMGNATNAYGQVYYSINNGTWTAFSGATYTNTYKWKYTALIDPVFDNQSSVRIGFRWANNSTNSAPSASFAIDDIRIVGNFDVGFVGITIDTLQMVPVCQNFNFLANFNLNNTLCGAGFYEAELSNASGNFNNPTSLGTYQLSNQTAFQSLFLNIPANTSPGSCYKIRIARIDVTPNVLSNESDCFTILNCPNTINTLQPTMLSNPNDTICVGSVIDVTFFSTGIFTNNTYTVLLSDSLGNFSSSSNILGNLQSSLTFDPALGSLPGAIPGVLNSFTQPIPEGCNYYLKIISSDTLVLINVYGPFCVKHCDIQTNIFPNIQACINSINGFDTLINININQFDTTTIYASNNLFQLQLLNSMTFNVVNTGGFGSIAASSDTTMPISIPNLGGLAALGLQPGIYYARIVANNSSSMWNNLGTLIRVIIGAPQDIPLSVNAYNPTNFNGYLNVGDSTICLGQAIYFTVFPNYNSQSIYTWSLNTESNWSTDPSTGVLFNQVGNFYMSIIETNY